ncbi:hypothetical protein [Cyanobium sp. ATX-6F1]|uniref:hypothetical protein n=1 Tax=Cyanobium sp. ATX-6F1 TaxID=3137388 RepID=UPI0039BDDA5F
MIIALLDPRPVAHLAERLVEACEDASHQFWSQEISLLQHGLNRWDLLLGPLQITDAYLLELDAAKGGRFVSFDQRISLELVPMASEANLSISRLV